MNTPVRLFVSNCASCVAVISVGPFGRPLLSPPNRSPDCPPDPEAPGACFAVPADCFAAGDCFAEEDFPAAPWAAEVFVPESDFCCATPRTVPKQTIAPNKMTGFFTDFIVVDPRSQS